VNSLAGQVWTFTTVGVWGSATGAEAGAVDGEEPGADDGAVDGPVEYAGKAGAVDPETPPEAAALATAAGLDEVAAPAGTAATDATGGYVQPLVAALPQAARRTKATATIAVRETGRIGGMVPTDVPPQTPGCTARNTPETHRSGAHEEAARRAPAT
jgi:hypothetical protein